MTLRLKQFHEVQRTKFIGLASAKYFVIIENAGAKVE